MRDSIPPLPNTSSRSGAYFKHKDNFTVYVFFFSEMRGGLLFFGDINERNERCRSLNIHDINLSLCLVFRKFPRIGHSIQSHDISIMATKSRRV